MKAPRVLVAEDNPTSRMVTEALLKKLSCEVDIAIDGREALQKAKDNDYDIVFMDCYMPLMDGFQATQRLRRSPEERGASHHRLDGQRGRRRSNPLPRSRDERHRSAKPVRISMLAKALERWVPVSGSRSMSPVSSLPPPATLDLHMVRQLVSLDGEDDDFIQKT